MGASIASAQNPLPKGWSGTQVGSPTPSGSTSEKKGVYTISGGGSDIWSTSDQFMFANRLFVGDGTIVARIDSVRAADPDTKVGIMFRESLSASSANALAMIDGAGNYQYQWRSASGNSTQYTYGPGGTAPIWLKLQRAGTQIQASRSSDGTTWTVIGTQSISMQSTIYAGLAVTSHNPAALATGVFSNVLLSDLVSNPQPPTPSPPGLPTGWTSTDIGGPTPSGSASQSNGVFTVWGGGADIWDTSDQFTFVNQPWTGDGTIVALVTDLDAADPATKVGVMMRESLAENAKNAMALIDGIGEYQYQWRSATGGTTGYTYGPGVATPIWLKLQRTGSQIQASRSSDGANWTVIGTQTISMQAAIYVGLAVTSHNPEALASAAFASVATGTGSAGSPAPGPVNQPPVITMSNPTDGASFSAPATIAFSANASDTDGTVTRVEFYAGPNMVGALTSAPYSYNWTSVPAGTYTVYALARDNSGNVTSTPQRTVTVRGSMPTTAIFMPSSNDSVAVTYYSIEFFPSATSPKAGAGVASQNLGKPTMINGQCQVNVGATIQGLQPGTYVGMVTAYGPSGSASSQPSLPFVR